MYSRVLERTEGHDIQAFAWPAVVSRHNGNGRQCALPSGKISLVAPNDSGSTGANDSQEEIERRFRDAYNRGAQDGEAAAKRAASDQVTALIDRLGATIVELADSHDLALRQAEPGMVKLAVEIARRILHRELTIDPNAVEGLIRAGIERLNTERVHTVRVHPDLEPAVRKCIERIAEGRQFEITPDPSQAPGTLMFQTEQGDLDASLETQLREIERGLIDGLPQ